MLQAFRPQRKIANNRPHRLSYRMTALRSVPVAPTRFIDGGLSSQLGEDSGSSQFFYCSLIFGVYNNNLYDVKFAWQHLKMAALQSGNT
ncbi:hypothetical protein NPIL_91811 [Nephila pilipes]|uniref:Uncharacterized protein n=1 Tax=Nephila pilipes TaxID=299642 RepID=A0A8X6NVB4_NEPPI|nr:hypothetical protein NPIL_91811 [Nephila pilipes]